MQKTTVILPVYNEGATIAKTIKSVLSFAKSNPAILLMFINDGSSDYTGYLLNENTKGIPNILIIENVENLGKARSIKKCVELAETEYICFTDGDLAYSLEHIHLLVRSLEDYDVVIGNRSMSENHLRNRTRHVFGESFNRLARIMLNMNFTDTQAGLKGFRKEIAKKLFATHLINDFAFDAELLYIAKLKGFSIGQIPAKVNEYHQFRPSNVKILIDSPKMFFSLLKIIYYRLTGRYHE